jgi:very-short-patch-repair endonuclease
LAKKKKKLSKTYNFQKVHPELSKEWHSKNLPLTPDQITPGSSKKIWWQCQKVDYHVYCSPASERVRGQGCPYCKGRRTHPKESLKAKKRLLSKEWDYEKNEKGPENYTLGSDYKAWWICSKNEEHKWQVGVRFRVKGSGCPFCAGQKISEDNNLDFLRPDLRESFHYEKNHPKTLKDFTAGTNKKVWWKCEKHTAHEYSTYVSAVVNGSRCPICAGKQIDETNSLEANQPQLLSEWDYEKNTDIKPSEIASQSGKKVWWRCLDNPEHSWDATPADRTNGRGCPYCSGARLSYERSLEGNRDVYEHLINEWDFEKNEKKPSEVHLKSGQKYWWICSNNPEHKWEATLSHRVGSTSGCPLCDSGKTSKSELRIFTELKMLLPFKVERRKIIDGVEADIYIDEMKLAIEFDGVYWHKDKGEADKKKNEFFQSKGIELLRVREKGLEQIEQIDILIGFDLKLDDLKLIVSFFLDSYSFDSETRSQLKSYLSTKSFVNEKEFVQAFNLRKKKLEGKSIPYTHPEWLEEWDYEKNGELDPYALTYGSKKKVWWKCEKSSLHSYKMEPNTKARDATCPYCLGRKVCADNNLAYLYPSLVKEWDFKKNGSLKPDEITPKSHKKVWWNCPKDKDHSYESLVASRTDGRGCPYCSGRKPDKKNNLKIADPKVAKEFDLEKNDGKRPEDYTPNSSKKVWWKCKLGHSWDATIANRVSLKSGCPYCSGAKLSKDMSVGALFPELLEIYDSEKNEKTLFEYGKGSHEKVWWKCKKDSRHSYKSSIASRVDGRRCPYCSGAKVDETNSLKGKFPEIAKLWHPTRNEVGPDEVTAGSTKKYWWICTKNKDHEHEATPGKKTTGRGCPYCSNKKVNHTNSLETLNPTLAKEWDFKKNKLTPSEVTTGSSKKVWWRCTKDKKHSWQATVNARSNGIGRCPFCEKKK